MSKFKGFNHKVRCIWSVAELLRGNYEAHEYGQVILPLTVLRRLDCVLEPTKDLVLATAKGLVGRFDKIDPVLLRAAGQPFYNVSPLNFTGLLDDVPNLAANLRTYIAGFSTGAVKVLHKYGFDNQITRLDNAGLLHHVISHFAGIDLRPDAVSDEVMGYVLEVISRTPAVTSSVSVPNSVEGHRVQTFGSKRAPRAKSGVSGAVAPLSVSGHRTCEPRLLSDDRDRPHA